MITFKELVDKISSPNIETIGDLAQVLNNRILRIYDEVSSISRHDFENEMYACLASGISEPITVIIDTIGGSVPAGIGIHDMIVRIRQRMSVKINTLICGQAASMGAILLQAGERRIATRNSMIMLHEVSQYKFFETETTSDHAEKAAIMKKMQNGLFEILSRRIGKTVQELESLTMKKNVWFDAEEALAYGLIDEIEG